MMQLVLRLLLLLLLLLVKVRVVVAVIEARPSRRVFVLLLLLLRLLLVLLLLRLLLVRNGVLNGRDMAVTALIVAPERHVGGKTGTRVRQWVGRPRSKEAVQDKALKKTRMWVCS